MKSAILSHKMLNFANLLRRIDIMINRELIRLKTVQIVYAYYQNGKNNGPQGAQTAEKELLFSLEKSYELYQALFLLMQEVQRIAVEDVDQRKLRARQLGQPDTVSTKFINNRFMQLLMQNKQLIDYREAHNQLWITDEELAKSIYRSIQQSIVYQEYLESGEGSFEEDREIWRRIYKDFFCNNEDVDAALEEKSLYWNDDKHVIDTFVLKTIKRFTAETEADAPLLPDFDSSEDREFAASLIHHALKGEEQYRQLIGENLRNWDFSRIALMDLIIMQIALAELLSYPSIPVSVSINEYVNIAKSYSTPRSSAYVNGMLDGIAKKLNAQGVLVKD